MYISKNKSIEQLTKESGKSSELFDSLYYSKHIISNEVTHASFFTVWQVVAEEDKKTNSTEIGFSFIASFNNLKDAIDYGNGLENPTMVEQGYEIIKLHASLSLVVYYHNEADGTFQMIDEIEKRYNLNDNAYKIGDTGISVCIATPVDDLKGSLTLNKEKANLLYFLVGEALAKGESDLEPGNPEEHDPEYIIDLRDKEMPALRDMEIYLKNYLKLK